MVQTAAFSLLIDQLRGKHDRKVKILPPPHAKIIETRSPFYWGWDAGEPRE
jgi:hypothetical protein